MTTTYTTKTFIDALVKGKTLESDQVPCVLKIVNPILRSFEGRNLIRSLHNKYGTNIPVSGASGAKTMKVAKSILDALVSESKGDATMRAQLSRYLSRATGAKVGISEEGKIMTEGVLTYDEKAVANIKFITPEEEIVDKKDVDEAVAADPKGAQGFFDKAKEKMTGLFKERKRKEEEEEAEEEEAEAEELAPDPTKEMKERRIIKRARDNVPEKRRIVDELKKAPTKENIEMVETIEKSTRTKRKPRSAPALKADAEKVLTKSIVSKAEKVLNAPSGFDKAFDKKVRCVSKAINDKLDSVWRKKKYFE